MDPERFDALVKSLTSSGSRRRLLGGVLAGSLAPLAAGAKAKPNHRRRDHDHDHDRDHAPSHDRGRDPVAATGAPDDHATAAANAYHGPEPAKCLAVGKRCARQDAESDRHGAGKGKRQGKGKHHSPSCAKCCSRFGAAGSDGKARCACKPEGDPCDNPSQCCGGLCKNGGCTKCPGDLTACDGQCVDLQTDPDHCGDCAASCAIGQRCVDGTCVCDAQSCPNGCCDDQQTCQRGTSDQACGDGGAACQACGPCATCDGTTCAGQSAVCCGDTAVCADGVCTPCAADAPCRNGACGCDPGFHPCGAQCVRDDDVAHCGTACDPCPTSVCSPATCDGTACGRAPIAGCCDDDGECDDSDVCTTDTCDQATHTCRHAPSDGAACGDGGLCCGGGCCEPPANARPVCPVAGACTFACDVGFHLCNGQCVSDDAVAHCGGSCDPCPTDPHGTATCSGGTCGLACDAGFALCGGACCGGCCDGAGRCQPGTDRLNCGAKGQICDACSGPQDMCQQGACVCMPKTCANACGAVADGCGNMLDCVCPICQICGGDGHCILDPNMPEGAACDTGKTCVSGQCVPSVCTENCTQFTSPTGACYWQDCVDFSPCCWIPAERVIPPPVTEADCRQNDNCASPEGACYMWGTESCRAD
jgi:hypothetical protein